MVLVFDTPSSYIGLLQTKRSHREGPAARRIGEEAMPLDEDSKGGHGEGEAGVEVLPDSGHALLERAHDGEPGEPGLNEQTILPLAALTQLAVRRVPRGGMAGGLTQDAHASVDLPNQPLPGLIGDSGRGTVPPYHEAIVVSKSTECAADHPAMVGEALPA